VYAQNKQDRYRNSITNITPQTIYQQTYYIKLEKIKMLKCISLAFKIMVLWDVTPCSLVDRYHTAGKTYYPFYTFPP